LKVTTSTRLARVLRELIGGEGLAEAHLRVPEEARDGVHVLRPDGVEVVVGLVHGGALLGAHGNVWSCVPVKRCPVRSSVSTVFTSLSVQRIHSNSVFAQPFLDEGGAHLVVGEGRAVVALGELIQLDGVVLDVGGLELLGDALLHVARGLPHLEQARVRLVRDGVGVDARPGLRLWR
jgi:hypothetical protein